MHKMESVKLQQSTNLQTQQPPMSTSGSLTTRVSRIIIGLAAFESPGLTFLQETDLSLQFEQHQSPCGVESKPKQAAQKRKR